MSYCGYRDPNGENVKECLNTGNCEGMNCNKGDPSCFCVYRCSDAFRLYNDCSRGNSGDYYCPPEYKKPDGGDPICNTSDKTTSYNHNKNKMFSKTGIF